MLVFHGSPHIVEYPICAFGRDCLDFGKGFYMTDIRLQAEDWARRNSLDNDACVYLNIYSFDKESYLSNCRSKIFSSYDEEWLQFIVDSRLGREPWASLDYVEGGVANDRVFDTVNLYISGLMDLETALRRLSMHKPNNQICLLNQDLTNRFLKFEGYEELF